MSFRAGREGAAVEISYFEGKTLPAGAGKSQGLTDKKCHSVYRFLAACACRACRERSWSLATLLKSKGL
jgi:hypothetical protein